MFPLPRYKISLEGDSVVVDKRVEYRWERGDWDKPSSYLDVSVTPNNDIT